VEAVETILSRICGKPLSPVDFTALFQTLLISYFSSPENILDPNLKSLVYRPDDTTGIIIEAAGRWNPGAGDHRPAILISRGEWKVSPPSLGLGLIQGGGEPDTYLIGYTGSHNIICIGKTPAAADTLGGEILHFISQVMPKIRESLPVSRILVVGLSDAKPFDEGRTHFAVSIPIMYEFEVRWTISISSGTTTTTPAP